MRVLVTGSSRGIGFGIAEAFAKQGHTVILNGREDRVRLEEAVQELGGSTVGYCADVSDFNQAQQLFMKIEENGGPVDVLINNAGMAHLGLFSDMPPVEIDCVLTSNLQAVLYPSRLAVPGMVRKKAGAIVNISSIWGVTGASCEVVYSAAKAGVIGFTKALARELGPSNIRVNAIACGAFETRMNDWLTDHERADFIENIPLGRFGQPSEVGELAVFLSEDSAAYLTGQVIALDGGIL